MKLVVSLFRLSNPINTFFKFIVIVLLCFLCASCPNGAPSANTTTLYRIPEGVILSSASLGMTAAYSWQDDGMMMLSQVIDKYGGVLYHVFLPETNETFLSIPSDDGEGSLGLRIKELEAGEWEFQLWEVEGEVSMLLISSSLQEEGDTWTRFDGILPYFDSTKSIDNRLATRNGNAGEKSPGDDQDYGKIERPMEEAKKIFPTGRLQPVIDYAVRVSERITEEVDIVNNDYKRAGDIVSRWQVGLPKLINQGIAKLDEYIKEEIEIPSVSDAQIESLAQILGDSFTQAKVELTAIAESSIQTIMSFVSSIGLFERDSVPGVPLNMNTTNLTFSDGSLPVPIQNPTSPPNTMEAPYFDPPGGYYDSAKNVSILCEDADAIIHYSTDENPPSITDGIEYSGPITISEQTLIRAIAYKPGWEISPTSVALYIITGVVAAPQFSPTPGAILDTQTIEISSSTENATIRYTTDGSDPTSHHGIIYVSPFHLSQTTQIKAIAYKERWTDSPVSSGWFTFMAIGSIGPAGGTVFYDKGFYSDGWRYFEAAPTSAETARYGWGEWGIFVNGTDAAIGAGEENTQKIVAKFGDANPSSQDSSYAAKVCSDLVFGGYDDWFLPSKDELNLMYEQKETIGGLLNREYWSSTESKYIYSSGYVWFQDFSNGTQHEHYSLQGYGARGIRAIRRF